MVPLLVMWGLAMVLIVIQRDLGAALMLFSVFLAMIYVATSRGLYAGIGLVAFVIGAYALYHFLPIVKLRVGLWLDPWSQERGYQSIQSIYALASGGVLGSGIGKGMPLRGQFSLHCRQWQTTGMRQAQQACHGRQFWRRGFVGRGGRVWRGQGFGLNRLGRRRCGGRRCGLRGRGCGGLRRGHGGRVIGLGGRRVHSIKLGCADQ
jgi:hypothetical protein